MKPKPSQNAVIPVRRALLLGLLVLCCNAVVAQDVNELQAQVEAQRADLATLEAGLVAQQDALAEQQQQLERVRAMSADLTDAKARALEAMNAQYQRIVDDPTLDLSETQAVYRAAIESRQRHEARLAADRQQITRQRQQLEDRRRAIEDAKRILAVLERDYDLARVARLQQELSRTDAIRITNTITCAPDETIAGCSGRGEQAARDAALDAFVDQLLAAASDSEALDLQPGSVAVESSLVDSRVESSGFRGHGDYHVELQARVASRVTPAEACRVLGLEQQACTDLAVAAASSESGPPDRAPSSEAESETDAVAQAASGSTDAVGREHVLTVRSNVYYDEVFIDGVAYGSTRLDVRLPAGEYALEVRKPGYGSYTTVVELDGDQTIVAQLEER